MTVAKGRYKSGLEPRFHTKPQRGMENSSAKRQKQTCKKCDNQVLPGNFGFCSQHREKPIHPRSKIAQAQAAASDDPANVVVTNVVQGSEPDCEVVLVPSHDLFQPGAGSIHAPHPTPDQQQHLMHAQEVRAEGIAGPEYTIMPDVTVVGSRSSHLRDDRRPSPVAQSIANIGALAPNHNFVGRIHQAMQNPTLVVPAVNADAVLGNHLPEMHSPGDPTTPQQAPNPTAPVQPYLVRLPPTFACGKSF